MKINLGQLNSVCIDSLLCSCSLFLAKKQVLYIVNSLYISKSYLFSSSPVLLVPHADISETSLRDPHGHWWHDSKWTATSAELVPHRHCWTQHTSTCGCSQISPSLSPSGTLSSSLLLPASCRFLERSYKLILLQFVVPNERYTYKYCTCHTQTMQILVRFFLVWVVDRKYVVQQYCAWIYWYDDAQVSFQIVRLLVLP